MIDNVQIAQQLLAVQERLLAVLESQRDLLKDQLGLVQSVTDAASANSPAAGGLMGQLLNAQKALDAVGKDAETTEQKVVKSMTECAKKAGTLSSSTWSVVGVFKEIRRVAPLASLAGMSDAFSDVRDRIGTVVGIGRSLVFLLGQVATSAYNVAGAIVSIPFRIFNGLIRLASALAAEYKHIAEAFEAFRGQFGSFTNEVGLALKDGLETAKQMGDLAGLGFYNVFQDTAGAIKFFQENFVGLGPLMDTFGREIGSLGDQFVHFVKGLGLSAEEVKTLSVTAKTYGRSMREVFAEVSNVTLQMADTFGISNKSLAKDVVSMVGNVKTFGNATVRSMTAAAVRVRSLGLEVKALDGVVDKFLNFEDAAVSASKLSQAFGLNLDTIGLMNSAAKDQAGLIDRLRNSFFAAGNDAERMSTAELRLLSQQTGLSESEARLTFSLRNRGKSLEEIRKQSQKAENAELSQAKMMEKLADAIERVIRVFQYKSFFGAFFQGFSAGVKHAAPFISMLTDLQAALDRTREAGFAVGQMFVSRFPGVMKMLEALRDTFNSVNFSRFKEKLTDTFSDLFDDLVDVDPRTAMEGFWDRLRKSFEVVTKAQSENLWGPLQDGFFDFMGALGKIVSGSVPLIREQVTQILRKVSDVISGELSSVPDAASANASSFGTRLWQGFLGPVWKSLVEAWQDPAFQDALSDLWVSVAGRLEQGLKKVGKFLLDNPRLTLGVVSVFTALFAGPAVISGVTSGLVTLGGIITLGLTSLISSLAGTIPLLVGGSIATALAGAVALLGSSVVVARGIDKFSDQFSGKFNSEVSSKVAAVVASAARDLSLGLIPDDVAVSLGGRIGGIRDQLVKQIKNFPIVGDTIASLAEDSMDTVLDSLGSFGNLLVKTLTGDVDPDDFRRFGQSVGKSIKVGFKTVLFTFPKLMGETVALMGVSLLKYAPKMLSNVTKAFSFVHAAISGLVSEIPLVGGPISAVFSGFSWLLTNVSSLLGDFSGSWERTITRISEVWDGFDFSEVVSRVAGFVKDTVVPAVTDIGRKIVEGLRSGMSGLPGVMKDSFVDGIGDVKDYLGIRSPSTFFRDQIGANMADGLTRGLSGGLTDLPNVIAQAIGDTDLVSAVTGDAAVALQEVVSQIASINASLASIPEIDIPLKLEKVGKVLGVKDNTLKVDLKPVNVTLNLTVTVEADKLATVLLDTKRIMPK